MQRTRIKIIMLIVPVTNFGPRLLMEFLLKKADFLYFMDR